MRAFQFTILVLSLSLGCSSEEVRHHPSEISQAGNSSTNSSSQSNSSGKEISSGTFNEAEPSAKINAYRKVIYDAQIDLIVNEFSRFTLQLPEIVVATGGYVADVKLQQRQDVEQGSSFRSGIWKVKVLSEKFDEFILKLSDIGFVKSHDQTAEDVTEAYIDLKARIENKTRMEARVLELIDQSSRKLNEIMNLEKELSRIRGEIERMQGRMNMLANRTEFATLTISAVEKKEIPVAVMPSFGVRVSESWSNSLSLLTSYAQGLVVFMAAVFPWVVVLGVVFVVVGLLVLICQRRLKINWRFRQT